MRSAIRLTVVLFATIAAPVPTPAFLGHDEIGYPVRYRVAVLARFSGRRLKGEDYSVKWVSVTARKVERDVLSFDGPDAFHWEKPLRDGTPLAGTYFGIAPESVTFHADVDSHPALSRGLFPFNRTNGICRAGLATASLGADFATFRARSSYDVSRPQHDLMSGTTRIRFKGKRL